MALVGQLVIGWSHP